MEDGPSVEQNALDLRDVGIIRRTNTKLWRERRTRYQRWVAVRDLGEQKGECVVA